MRLALAQINAVVGDLAGNRERILAALADARSESAELVVFPELAVTGYPPEDLLLRPPSSAQRSSQRARSRRRRRDRRARRHAVGVRGGAGERMCRVRRGRAAGALPEAAPPQLRRLRRGALLRAGHRRARAAARRPARRRDGLRGRLAAGGPPPTSPQPARSFVNLSASPSTSARRRAARRCSRNGTRDNGLPLVFCNLVGGQDEPSSTGTPLDRRAARSSHGERQASRSSCSWSTSTREAG